MHVDTLTTVYSEMACSGGWYFWLTIKDRA